MTKAGFRDRLWQLRRRGAPGVAPLWAGLLAPAEVLAEFGERREGWAVILCAKALADLGRGREARARLAMLTGLPDKLAAIAATLEVELRSLPVEEAAEGDADRSIAALERWLSSVRRWRGGSAGWSNTGCGIAGPEQMAGT